ncbi:hypothetical protein Lal_00025915 [Lupinus albus]|nr:hypothetical protein Lal_00025915 [Lupinus albus]
MIRKRLILKLPAWDSSEPMLEITENKFNYQDELVASSKTSPEASDVNRKRSSSKDPSSGSGNYCTIKRTLQVKLDYVDYIRKIGWRMVKLIHPNIQGWEKPCNQMQMLNIIVGVEHEKRTCSSLFSELLKVQNDEVTASDF